MRPTVRPRCDRPALCARDPPAGDRCLGPGRWEHHHLAARDLAPVDLATLDGASHHVTTADGAPGDQPTASATAGSRDLSTSGVHDQHVVVQHDLLDLVHDDGVDIDHHLDLDQHDVHHGRTCGWAVAG